MATARGYRAAVPGVALAAALWGCAGSPRPDPAAPAPAMSDGATEWFAAGMPELGRDGAELRVRLLRPAYGAVLRLDQEGAVTLLWTGVLAEGRARVRVPGPAQVTSSERVQLGQGPSGAEIAANAVRAEADRAACLARRTAPRPATTTGPAEPAPAPTVACVSRTPRLAPAEVVTVRRSVRVRDHLLLVVADVPISDDEIVRRLAPVREIDFAALAHDLPEYLVGDRTAMWAGYLVRR